MSKFVNVLEERKKVMLECEKGREKFPRRWKTLYSGDFVETEDVDFKKYYRQSGLVEESFLEKAKNFLKPKAKPEGKDKSKDKSEGKGKSEPVKDKPENKEPELIKKPVE